ncbi:MAG: neutral zinc metallopeptidase [Propionibacteriales bacterium]|nr:neutral zinc metallopeptidase [Propionibacteriales bacterium]
MQYEDGAKLDPSQVGGGGGGGRRGGGIAIGGGGAIIVIILALVFGFDPSVILGGGTTDQPVQPGESQTTLQNCQNVKDIETDRNCRYVAYTNSIQAYWETKLEGYQVTKINPFTSQVSTGCGQASAESGPFYCPQDQQVYLDIEFLDQLLSQLGAQGGDAAEAYVVAHEFGHHVQNLTGVMAEAQQDRSTGPKSAGVRLELQADCLAGTWFANEQNVAGSPVGDFTEQDLNAAVDAARAVGDDRIQQQSGGGVNPDGWTHGSSEQRRKWLQVGYSTGDPGKCDTFNTDNLG